jgi:hypothetical protein
LVAGHALRVVPTPRHSRRPLAAGFRSVSVNFAEFRSISVVFLKIMNHEIHQTHEIRNELEEVIRVNPGKSGLNNYDLRMTIYEHPADDGYTASVYLKVNDVPAGCRPALRRNPPKSDHRSASRTCHPLWGTCRVGTRRSGGILRGQAVPAPPTSRLWRTVCLQHRFAPVCTGWHRLAPIYTLFFKKIMNAVLRDDRMMDTRAGGPRSGRRQRDTEVTEFFTRKHHQIK